MIGLVERIVDAKRVLVDGLHIEQELLASGLVQFGRVDAVVEHLALSRFGHAHEQPRQGGLAAAALAGQRGHGRAVVRDGKGDIFDRHRRALAESTAAKDL